MDGVIRSGCFMTSRRNAAIAALAVSILFTSCTGRSAPAAIPPAPEPASVPQPKAAAEQAARAAPVITEFTAEPSGIFQGQSATLRWHVAGEVTRVTIDQVGTVDQTGTRNVSPKASTVYKLTAIGLGSAEAATLVIRVLPPLPPISPNNTGSSSRAMLEDRISTDLHDVYFDYGSNGLGENARQSLVQNAAALKAIIAEYPSALILLEGHCDERGSAEYDLALGGLRASATMQVLVQLGISPDRVTLVSYGKEQPQCADANESCWQRNRRVHFVPAGSPGDSQNRNAQ